MGVCAEPELLGPKIPYLDGLELLHVPCGRTGRTRLLTGSRLPPNVSLDARRGIKRKDIVGTVRYLGEPNSYQVHINNERKPFNDPRYGAPSTWRSSGKT